MNWFLFYTVCLPPKFHSLGSCSLGNSSLNPQPFWTVGYFHLLLPTYEIVYKLGVFITSVSRCMQRKLRFLPSTSVFFSFLISEKYSWGLFVSLKTSPLCVDLEGLYKHSWCRVSIPCTIAILPCVAWSHPMHLSFMKKVWWGVFSDLWLLTFALGPAAPRGNGDWMLLLHLMDGQHYI